MPTPSATVQVNLEPHVIGPCWLKDDSGNWILPVRTLGWQVIAWAADNLLNDEGGPWSFTLEQARLVLWFYAVDENGRFLYREGVVQRMKGWGKDPLAAVLCAVELVGPSQFSHFDHVGNPIGKPHPRAWVQLAAVAAKQNINTMGILRGLFSEACIREHRIDIGAERILAHGGVLRLEIVTSSFRSTEGNRPTFVVFNETHHWVSSNGGHELRAALRRNATKAKFGMARFLSITNSYKPGEDSVAEQQRLAYMDAIENGRHTSRILYDSLEAPTGSTIVPGYTRWDEERKVGIVDYNDDGTPIRPTFEEAAKHLGRILDIVKGDAYWLNIPDIIEEISNGETSVEDSKRFYYNSVELGDDTSFDPDDIRATIDPEVAEWRRGWEGDTLRIGWRKVKPDEPIVMFGDGSKSDDSTAVIGCRLSDGYVFTIGIWERPPKGRTRTWTAPRDEIDARVHEAMTRFKVSAFWFDPSHAKEDETGGGYWDSLVDAWHREWGDDWDFWAQQTGDRRNAVGWDMTNPQHASDFVSAVERFTDEMEHHAFTWDGHPLLKKHLEQGRRRMSKDGRITIGKASRTSAKKIDAAVCAIGARMLRRYVLNRGLDEARPVYAWWAPV